MATIFPVGKNRWDWLHKLSQDLGQELPHEGGVEGGMAEEDVNPNYEAVKDLPIAKEVEVSVDGVPCEETGLGSPAPEMSSPTLPSGTDTVPVATEIKPEEAAATKEEVKEVAQAAQDVAARAEELVNKLEETAKSEEGTPEGGEKKEAPAFTAPKSEEKKEEPKAEEKKEEKSEEKKEEPKEAKAKVEMTKEASPKKEYVRLAHTTSQTKEEIRSYWLALGFPKDYVDAMAKDYD